jgi:UDP-N-acetylmuramate: L-alanyl-gamma-D-glutamyl-meso-diaminopimelate ligase
LGCWSELEHFAAEGGWHAGPAGEDGGVEVFHGRELQGRLEWALLGDHNRLNALAAIAAARHAGVEPRAAIEALRRFGGVRRRMEIRGAARGVTVYDDFAHHPSAIRTTVAGLRAKVGADRILAVLEPRSNTMKLGIMKDALPASLEGADRVFVLAAGLGWDPAIVLAPLGRRAEAHGTLESLVAAVAAAARDGDHVLAMSNGGFGGFHDRLLRALRDGAAA